MGALNRYTPDQQAVLLASGMALAFTAAVLAAGYTWLPASLFDLEHGMDAGERMAFAMKAEVPVFLWLAGCVKAVSGGRFNSPADIHGSAFSRPSPAIAVRVAILQNSLEQTVLALGAHLALAAVVQGPELVLLPVLVLLYVFGRICFAAGYAKGASGRAFGMGVTGASTMFAYSGAVVLMATRG